MEEVPEHHRPVQDVLGEPNRPVRMEAVRWKRPDVDDIRRNALLLLLPMIHIRAHRDRRRILAGSPA